MRPTQTLCFTEVHRFLTGLFDGDMHAKRVLSLTNATLGVIRTASLAVSTIGQGLALARGRITKHAIKQVDRLLSNEGIDVDAALRSLGPFTWWDRAPRPASLTPASARGFAPVTKGRGKLGPVGVGRLC